MLSGQDERHMQSAPGPPHLRAPFSLVGNPGIGNTAKDLGDTRMSALGQKQTFGASIKKVRYPTISGRRNSGSQVRVSPGDWNRIEEIAERLGESPAEVTRQAIT